MRFSSTVRLEKINLPSGDWLIPSLTIFPGFRLDISSPLYFIEPPAVFIIPDIARNVDVLPAPFEPIKVTIELSGT